MSKIVLGLILGLVIAGAVFYSYNLGKKQSVPNPISQATPSPSSVASPSATPDMPIFLRERPTAGFTDPSGTIKVIKEAFNKMDLSLGFDLGAWMADPVNIVLFATECCGNKGTKDADNQIDAFAVKGISPWDCSDTNLMTKKVLAKDSVSFKDMTICTSANGLLIGFHLDNEFLIDRIILVNDIKQITGP